MTRGEKLSKVSSITNRTKLVLVADSTLVSIISSQSFSVNFLFIDHHLNQMNIFCRPVRTVRTVLRTPDSVSCLNQRYINPTLLSNTRAEDYSHVTSLTSLVQFKFISIGNPISESITNFLIWKNAISIIR